MGCVILEEIELENGNSSRSARWTWSSSFLSSTLPNDRNFGDPKSCTLPLDKSSVASEHYALTSFITTMLSSSSDLFNFIK